ncbi:kinesin-like protein KIN-14F isoform X2 [Dioscorea cayenensis subsp. rotundata]|uniref:Kinesin-like protein KIN-14F isoform X2 n=1 Tax=Dioscorea cayennensis subsp. rotundata TaxID=55577 RepID=A0AB40BH95_DIOCR|nr:kinesin-like protein KIN-14F isoform X2 [Dioscorea cayenensis subsp. rotundata]
MASEGVISMMSVVEDVLKQQGKRLNDMDLAWRKAEEAAARRNEAAGWLRKMVGVVTAKDLPEEPSEEGFRLSLRSGMILCNALNKVVPGAIPKVVETPGDAIAVPDGAALSAYQYFENVRNFLVAVEDLGIPTFEASDLEQGGKSSRVVHCVLALKSYHAWKQMGGIGLWKYGGNLKPTGGKYFMRKNSEAFMNSLSRTQSVNDKSFELNSNGDFPLEASEMGLQPTAHSLSSLVRAVLSDKKPEEIPLLVESMLSRVMEEFDLRIANQNELVKTTMKVAEADADNENRDISSLKADEELPLSSNVDIEDSSGTHLKNEVVGTNMVDEETSRLALSKQHAIIDNQQQDIQELRHVLHATRTNMEYLKKQYTEEFSNLGKHLAVLSHAASDHHKVLEENRKLYNQVQDLKGNIRVYCRVRPFLPGQSSNMNTIGRIDDGSITIVTPLKYGKEGRKSFTFNKVFGPSASQEAVFADTQPLIRSVLDGYNVCIFAYGQTGSGKTHTMSGPKELNKQTIGVNYRALNDLFHLSEERKDTIRYEIAVQMIEIYNEQVRDLLATDGVNKRLEIRNSSLNGVNVPDANLVSVTSTSEVVDLMNLGQRNRVVSATALNDRSSRSHSCLTIHVQGRDMTSGNILRGCMHLVDLAGSERVDKSEVKGDRLKEAQHINKSLSALGDVIASLAQKNSHVPYRNSKLTQLLQDSLGGQAKTLMFVHISPEADATGETLSTLKFAERVASVELGVARVNKESGEIKELKEQIVSLRAALARKEGETEYFPSTMSSPDRYTLKTGATSPLIPNHRQPMEEVGNIEVQRNSSVLQKSSSFDLQQLLEATGSHPWSESTPNAEIGTRDWIDKFMFNKPGAVLENYDSLRDWEGDNGNLPDIFYQRYQSDMKVHPEQQYNRNITGRKENGEHDLQRNRFDTTTTDDSDDLDVTTSDSSEADALWQQFNLPKISSTPNMVGSKLRKPQARSMKSPDIRTQSHSHIPSPSRKLPNQPLNRNTRLPTFDSKRILSTGKTGK